MKALFPYLGDIQHLTDTSLLQDGKTYVHPRFRNLGVVTMVVLRQAINPVVFRNAEAEITDIDVNGDAYVRAVPNKFKYVERARGLQLLRYYEVGGRYPQNRTVVPKNRSAAESFDLNSLVFGDSANGDNRILPVRAAVNYSDALSLLPMVECVEETFHNRAYEDGTLFDAETKGNSPNLFSRHFIRPGTLMIQVLSTQGRVLPPIGLQHLLLSMGLAGTYGGQTSLTGTNIRTHLVGVYADRFERPESSPYVLLPKVHEAVSREKRNVPQVVAETVDAIMRPHFALTVDGPTVTAWQENMVAAFLHDDPELRAAYIDGGEAIAKLFATWFDKPGSNREKKSQKMKVAEEADE